MFNIFELTLIKLIRNLVLNFRAFLPSKTVFIESNFKKIYKFLKAITWLKKSQNRNFFH